MVPATLEPTEPRGAAKDYFSIEHLHDDLKGRSVRGGVATIGGRAAGLVVRVGSTAVLARLLTPTDFGLIAMVTAVIGFVELFKDLGLSRATIQRERINHQQVSMLFWTNVAVSLLLMLVGAALAPAIAWFYGEPRLMPLTLALAATFPLGGLTVQHHALLARQMRFGALALIAIVSQVVGIATAITAALLGAGYWALVAMTAATAATNTTMVWLLCDWRPSAPRRASGVRPMLDFGLHLSASEVVTFLQQSMDKILLGATWGAGPLGLYAKAQQLTLLPAQQINNPAAFVAVPALSRLQEQPDRYRRYYCRFIEIIASVGMPIAAFVLVAADAIVLTLLGEQWIPCTLIFRLLAPAALMRAINVAGGTVFVSMGRSDKQLYATIFAFCVSVVAFTVGLRWGPLGIATGLSVAVTLYHPIVVAYALRGSPVSLKDLGASIARPLVASFVATGALWTMTTSLPIPSSPLASLAAQGVSFAVFYLLAWCLLPGGWRFLLGTGLLLRRDRRYDLRPRALSQ